SEYSCSTPRLVCEPKPDAASGPLEVASIGKAFLGGPTLTARSPEGAPQHSPGRDFAALHDVGLRDGGSILFCEVIESYGSRADERDSPLAAVIAHSCVVGNFRQ